MNEHIRGSSTCDLYTVLHTYVWFQTFFHTYCKSIACRHSLQLKQKLFHTILVHVFFYAIVCCHLSTWVFLKRPYLCIKRDSIYIKKCCRTTCIYTYIDKWIRVEYQNINKFKKESLFFLHTPNNIPYIHGHTTVILYIYR